MNNELFWKITWLSLLNPQISCWSYHVFFVYPPHPKCDTIFCRRQKIASDIKLVDGAKRVGDRWFRRCEEPHLSITAFPTPYMQGQENHSQNFRPSQYSCLFFCPFSFSFWVAVLFCVSLVISFYHFTFISAPLPHTHTHVRAHARVQLLSSFSFSLTLLLNSIPGVFCIVLYRHMPSQVISEQFQWNYLPK